MKSKQWLPAWVIGILGWTLALACQGQVNPNGTVSFANSSSTRVINVLTGQPVAPDAVRVGLYFSVDLGAVPRLDVPEDGFKVARVTNLIAPGIFVVTGVPIPDTIPGQRVLLQVRVWSAAYDTYGDAVIHNDPLLGASILMELSLGGGILPTPSLVVQGRLRPFLAGYLPAPGVPVALPGAFSVVQYLTLTAQVSAWDPDADPLTFALATPPGHGTLLLQSSGQLSYTPDFGYTGSDSFEFIASDGAFVSAPARVTLNVIKSTDASGGTVVFANSESTAVTDAWTGQNVAPGAISVGLYFNENLNAVPKLDVPNDGFDLAHITGIHAAGLFNGGTVPIPGTIPSQTVQLQVRVWSASFDNYSQAVTNNDPLLGASNLMRVRLGGGNPPAPTLVDQGGLKPFFAGPKPAANPPVALPGAISVLANSTVTSQLTGSDIDGDTLTFAMASPPALGVVTIQPGGQFTYVPFSGSLGSDSFTFSATDGLFTSPPATIMVTIHPNAGTLVFNNGGASRVLDGRTGYGAGTGLVLAGLYVCTDTNAIATPGLPGDPFQRVAVTPVSDGLSATAPGFFKGGTNFIPGTHPGQKVLVQVRCWPVGVESFEQAVLEPERLVGVSAVIGPLSLGQPGLPAPQLADAPQLGYITLRYLSGAHPPAALTANFTTQNNMPLAGTIAGSDPDGDALTFVVSTPPGHGTLTFQSGGQFTYNASAGYGGIDAFSFYVNDGVLDSAPTTVTINVLPIYTFGGTIQFANGPSTSVIDGKTGQPIGPGVAKVGLYYSTNLQASVDPTMAEDDLILVRVATIFAGGVFLGGIVIIPEWSSGNLVLLQVRTWPAAYATYADAFSHEDSFLGASNPMVLALGGEPVPSASLVNQGGLKSFTTAIVPRPHPPVAQNLAFTLGEDAPLYGQLLASDADGDPLVFSILSPPALGALNLSPSGGFVYLPRPNISGSDSFSFLANDGQENSAPALVTLTILPVNDPPAADFEIYPKIPWITAGPNPVILSPNNSNAVVVLDGSLSSDIDGSALDFGWIEGTGTIPFATEGITHVTLDIGLHTITLHASDGSATGMLGTTLEVMTPGAAVELLILEVTESTLDRNRRQPLISILKSAVASFERDSFSAALNQLGAFQNSVHAKLKKSDPDLARRWTDIAGEIVRTVSGP